MNARWPGGLAPPSGQAQLARAAGLHPPAGEADQAMGSRIRAVLVGAGVWGLEHARALAGRPDVDFRAVAGRTPARTQARAAQFAVRAYTSIPEMIEAEQPDLVCLSLPNQEHLQATLEVIRASRALLVEKPIAFELAEADALLEEAARRSLFFAIDFNHHYAKPVGLAYHALREGRLGEVVFASWRFGGEGGTSHPFNNLIETQCHAFDLLEFLCGPIDSVMAQMTDLTARGTYRTVALALHFRSGAVGSLVGSYDSSYAYPSSHQLEINGTRGRLLVEDTVRRFTLNARGSEVAEVWQAGYFNDRDRAFYRLLDRHLDAVLEALRSGGPPPIHARAGRRALLLAYAAIASFQGGRRVEVETASWEPAAAPAIAGPRRRRDGAGRPPGLAGRAASRRTSSRTRAPRARSGPAPSPRAPRPRGRLR
ncbi:MAG: Gfo/Idh/MocA family oxidoreductase [Anaeromyxobacter sp.]